MSSKKVISLTLLIILSIGVIFGLSPTVKAEKQEEPFKVNVLDLRQGGIAVLNKIMKREGEQMEPPLDVHTKSVNFSKLETEAKTILSSGSNSPYELFQAYNGFMPSYTQNDWVTPLGDYVDKYEEKYDLDDISQAMWDAVSFEGKIYGFPFQQFTTHLFYRKDTFEKHDLTPPKTVDQLFEVLETLKEESDFQYQLAMGLKKGYLNAHFHGALMAYGGKWFTEDNQPAFNSEAGVKAVKLLERLQKYMPPSDYSGKDVVTAISQGIVPMAYTWTSYYADMADPSVSQYPDKIAPAEAVSVTEDGPPIANWTQDMFVIPKNLSDKIDKEKVFKLVCESTTKENQRAKFASETIVSRRSILSDPEVQEKYPYYEATLKTVEQGAIPYPKVPYFTAERGVVEHYVSQALAGQLSIEKALEKAEKEVRRDLKQKGYLS